ncbi:NADP-dependent oxidoreductase [Dactylosporangium sp. CA-233914]|uniref:NADP-dependent oxidoreductase n=1 Tax=Dactylosporangium sp. CA-233914 TaxID=3239934 RepID=UPI003D940E2B
MLAVQFDRFGPPEVLHLAEAADPHPGPGEIRIRVRAAGISPVDLAIRAGKSPTPRPLPHIPGVDAAGVVDEIGAGVTGCSVGDEVFGTVPLTRLGGATAELAVLSAWIRRPASMPWPEAGAAGTSIETATRALDRLDAAPGAKLLITGAAGGVGSVAVQLAVARGLIVYGTARAESHEFVASLGATPLPRELGSQRPGAFDHALDTAGGGLLPDLIALTGTAAKVLTLADFGGPALGVALSMGELAGEPSGRPGLAAAAALAERGRFRVPIQAAYPMARAADAHRAVESAPRRGKTVITTAG